MSIKYQIGNVIEVTGIGPGLIGSYYEATLISKEGSRRYKVKYKNLLKEDKYGPLKEVVHVKYLCPISPNTTDTCYRLDECVDAYANHGLD